MEKNNSNLKGLVAWWDFNTIAFIEYIAVKKQLRYKGLGSELLEMVLNQRKTVVLEVSELGEEYLELVEFYKHKGFVENAYDYRAIPLRKNVQADQYRLYSFPEKMSQKQYNYFIACISNPRYSGRSLE